jgi:Flp pilus assembly CpaE family ATPase
LQQSTVVAQADPSGAQIVVGLQTPSLHSRSSQQSGLSAQTSPIGAQTEFVLPNRSKSPVRPHDAKLSTRVVTSAHAEAMRAASEGRMRGVYGAEEQSGTTRLAKKVAREKTAHIHDAKRSGKAGRETVAR